MRSCALGMLVCLAAGACVADVNGTHQESKQEEPMGSGENAQDTTTTPTGYLRQIASIYCEESFTCRASFPPDRGYTFEGQWTDTADMCKQHLLDAWNPAAIETEIAKGRAMYDGSAGIACLAGVAFGTCTDYWTSGIHWADACYRVIIGLVPAGGSCDNIYACASQSCDATTHTCM